MPKNLLYLTDRLPKPNYSNEEKLRREEEELKRRTTVDGRGSQMLPELVQGSKPKESKKAK